ncbi:MAG: hypothetical protein AB7R55_00710 [Gemmatimonadales bacterium]
MRKLLLGLVAVGAVTLAAGRTAEAQVRFGANLSWGGDTDVGLGARLNFGVGSLADSKPIEGLITFDYFFPDESFGVDATYWEISANAIYRFVERGKGITPYAGGGVLLARSSVEVGSGQSSISGSDSDIGLSILGGLRFKTAGTLIPFAEARIDIVADNSQLVLSGGVYFGQP